MRPGAEHRETSDHNGRRNKELQVVDPTSSSVALSSFKLPHGWVVKKRPSPSIAGRVDKYYYDPSTGQQFRSLISIQRYLNGEPTRTKEERNVNGEPMRPREERNINLSKLVPYNFKTSSVINLPNNWIVQEKPRSNVNYAGVIDRHFIDTETGCTFRSFRAVQRYLEEMGEDSTTLEELKAASESAKKQRTDESASKPAKVKWVLSGPGGNMWNAFIGDSMVSESINRKWSETFVLRIQDKQ